MYQYASAVQALHASDPVFSVCRRQQHYRALCGRQYRASKHMAHKACTAITGSPGAHNVLPLVFTMSGRQASIGGPLGP